VDRQQHFPALHRRRGLAGRPDGGRDSRRVTRNRAAISHRLCDPPLGNGHQC
jgi:hypothetical protein